MIVKTIEEFNEIKAFFDRVGLYYYEGAYGEDGEEGNWLEIEVSYFKPEV